MATHTRPIGAIKVDPAAKRDAAIRTILSADQGTLVAAALRLVAVVVADRHQGARSEQFTIEASYRVLAAYIDASRGEGERVQQALDDLVSE